MNIIKTTSGKTLRDIAVDAVQKQIENSIYCIYEKNYVIEGTETPPDYDYIKEHNIEILDIQTMGGTIVVSQGDIGFGLTKFTNTATNAFLEKARDNLLLVLEKHNCQTRVVDNDILVNGFKVASYCSKMLGNVCLGVFQLSVNVDLDLIQHISNKTMIKVPKGLSEFGITTEELEQDVILKTANETEL